ncbi:MAG: glycosyltransferase [Bacteroidetes bacterium]|nr:MAG: glycosyltransferase [Bacteroidota bacterium]
MPKLSIITVNYNNSKGLQNTIESVISQNYGGLEFIVIDGNSTDSSVAILKKYDSQIDKWISEPDTGVYQAMNKGIEMSDGEFILFLNSGDHFYHDKVLLSVDQNISNEEIICFDIHMVGLGKDKIKSHPDHLTFSYLFEKTFAHQSVFIKKELFKKVGLYDETLKIVSDWKFFIEAITFHSCSYKTVHQILTTYYLDGMSATAEGTFKRREEREKVLKNEFSLFVKDYERLQLLESNRFKILVELENSKIAKKINSLWLRILLKIFRNKNLKDL